MDNYTKMLDTLLAHKKHIEKQIGFLQNMSDEAKESLNVDYSYNQHTLTLTKKAKHKTRFEIEQMLLG